MATMSSPALASQAALGFSRSPSLGAQRLPATFLAPRRSSAAPPHTGRLTVSARAVDMNLYQGEVPTPTLPSGCMMAQFMLAYKRMLEHETPTGDTAASFGESVLERVRVGLLGLLHHPKHGAFASSAWRHEEEDLELCLVEIEKDINQFHRYHDRRPSAAAFKLAQMHCEEAARLLCHL